MLLNVDTTLLEAVIVGTTRGLEMTGVVPSAVGAGRFSTSQHPMSVLVGLVGRCSGTLTLSISEAGMCHLATGLVGEKVTALDEDSIDGMMEIGNMVAGCVKESLSGSEYEVQSISLPSLIIGSAYQVVYARGISSVSVQFELEKIGRFNQNDRFFFCTVSLLRGSGS